ncbi:Nuclear transport factor 2 [Tetrabaena socialis]|uniref:Nuclear transport factor 2 n=1 Tax=Tetrabaena socialis TaxID=47790 RepID=A0A2J8A617_9CHLO|nr:Nuclear transport factor 2 [Tetrabaena socialis]|eukprot:PNH07945.1 Nuclear transport factor 2 [Tetrabaena socialis]
MLHGLTLQLERLPQRWWRPGRRCQAAAARRLLREGCGGVGGGTAAAGAAIHFQLEGLARAGSRGVQPHQHSGQLRHRRAVNCVARAGGGLIRTASLKYFLQQPPIHRGNAISAAASASAAPVAAPEGESIPLKFSQAFHLMPTPTSSFVVTNDMFRLNYG